MKTIICDVCKKEKSKAEIKPIFVNVGTDQMTWIKSFNVCKEVCTCYIIDIFLASIEDSTARNQLADGIRYKKWDTWKKGDEYISE